MLDVEPALELLRPLMASKDADTALRAKMWSGELMLAMGRPVAEIAPLLPALTQGRFAAPADSSTNPQQNFVCVQTAPCAA